MNLAKFVEYDVTNRIGYNNRTNFTINNSRTFLRMPLQAEDIRSSNHALRTHLSHLEYKTRLPHAIYTFNLLRNAQDNYEFRFAGGERRTLNTKQRTKERKKIVRELRDYRKLIGTNRSLAQSKARISVFKSGKDMGDLVFAFLPRFSLENQN